MTAYLDNISATVGSEPIEKLAVVRLVDGIDIEAHGRPPGGGLGAVVFVHEHGKA